MKSFSQETFRLSKHQTIALKGEKFRISCLSGDIWVTWPKGKEYTLLSGQSVTGSSRGKVCVFAFSRALVRVEKEKGWWQPARFYRSVVKPNNEGDVIASPSAT